MSDDVTRPRPPAGWLMDSTTGLVRWWDGSRWTEHVRPDSLTGSHAVPVSPDAVAMEAPVAVAPVVAESVAPGAEPVVPELAEPVAPEPAGPPTRASLRASRRAAAGAEEAVAAPAAEAPVAPAPDGRAAEVPAAPAPPAPPAPATDAPVTEAPIADAPAADSSAPPPVSATRVREATRYGLPAAAQTSPQAQPLLPPSEPLTSQNGPAKASLILILLVALGLAAVTWLLTGMDPTVSALVTSLNVVMAIAAFGLAIVGLYIAIRRPTKKRESVFALVVSSLFIVYLGVSVYLRLTSTG